MQAVLLAVALFGILGATIWWAVRTIVVGGAPMSFGGWFFMVAGVIAAIGLAGVLMGLIFISSRRGYDDQTQDPTSDDELNRHNG